MGQVSQTTPTAAGRLRELWTEIPASGRLLLVAVVVDSLGIGLTLPFTVVYLHEVRGIPLPTVGLLMSLPPAVALLLLGPIGLAIDRFGARRVQVGALTFSMLGQIGLVFVHGPATAAAALAVGGLGSAAFFPANLALVSSVVPSRLRQRYFGLSFTVLNAGIGVGGIVAGLVVNVDQAWTFAVIYLADAASYLVPLVILLVFLRGVGGPPDHTSGPAAVPPTYAEVWRDRVFRRFLVVTFFVSFVGYAQLEAGWTAFVRFVADVSTRDIGIAFAVNTLVIVVFQLPVLQAIHGRRRTRMLIVMAGVWATAWAFVGVSGLVGGALAVGLVVASGGIFGLGETLNSPVSPSLVNDLASDQLRGRYNAANSIAFQMAAVLGPAIAGLLIGNGWDAAYIVMLLVGCAVLAGLLLSLERRIAPFANGVGPAEAAQL
jgi:MFS family permease